MMFPDDQPDDRTPERVELDLLMGLWASHAERPIETPAALLVRYDDDTFLIAFARPDRMDDNATCPITELGALAIAAVAHRGAARATMLVPIRGRDLTDDTIVATWLSATSLQRESEGWGISATRTRWEDFGDQVMVAPNVEAMLPDDSPVGSMLWEATQTPAPCKLSLAIEAAQILGLDVLHSDPGGLPTGSSSQADKARHRLTRLARELKRRHDPRAPAEVARRIRGPIPCDLPDGFVPAGPF